MRISDWSSDVCSSDLFWVIQPTLDNIQKLFFETSYPTWLWNTMVIAVVSTFLSLFCAVCAAYAIERLRFSGARFVGMAIFLAYLVPPSILFIRSEEHTSELQSLMRISYAVFCLTKKINIIQL